MNRRSICVAMSVRKRTVNGQWGEALHDSSRHRAAAPTRHRVEAGRSPGWGYQRRPSCHSLTSLILRLLRRVPARPSAVRAANRCGSSASRPTSATPISTSAITFASAARATTSSWLDRSRGPHGDQSRECLAGGCPIRAASAARGDAERARFLQQGAGRVDRARERVCAARRGAWDKAEIVTTCTNSAARKPEHSWPQSSGRSEPPPAVARGLAIAPLGRSGAGIPLRERRRHRRPCARCPCD